MMRFYRAERYQRICGEDGSEMNTYMYGKEDEVLDASSFNVRPYRSHRIDQYCQRMSSDNDFVQYDPNVANVLKAQGYEWIETPRSIYKVHKLYEALDKYAPNRIPDPKITPELEHGIALARACFARPSSRSYVAPLVLSFDTVLSLTSNPNASAGLTAWGCTKEEAMMRGYERGLQTALGEKKPEPCIAFTRTQFEEKTRLVWGYPYSMTILEGLFARPLIDEIKGSSLTPMAFGMSTHKLGSMLRVASRHKRYGYSVDMSSYDSSLSQKLIRTAFQIIRTWFDLSAIEPTSGIPYGVILGIVENYFIHTPIVMPDHKLYLGKKHGVPSGSYFTQMVDSICNVIICGTIACKFNMHVSKREIFVLGDDLLFWTNRNIGLDIIAQYATHTFGVQFNANKSTKVQWNDPVPYLGRIWTKGIPDQAMDKIIARMVYPERYRHYSDDPEQRRREVLLLLASFAATYSSANKIFRRVTTGDGWVIAPNADDFHVFGDDRKVNPDHLSGLQRYQLIYGATSERFPFPTSLVRMWIT